MEEGEAAPVRRLDAAAQFVPIGDLVDRLVADDLLEDVGRRRPVDRAQNEEAPIEPRGEQVLEIAVEAHRRVDRLRGGFPILQALAQREQILAHPHQREGAAAGEVEPPNQFLRARLGRHVQQTETGPRRVSTVSGDRSIDRVMVGTEFGGDEF